MKIKKLVICHLTLLFSLLAVSYSQTINLESILDRKEEIPLSDIAKKITYIPLESSTEALIGNIQKLIVINEIIVILDAQNGNSRILLFDMAGRFKGQIGSNGKGPGEYGQISDICYDRKNNEILVVTNTKPKVLRYSLKTGFKGNSIDIKGDVSLTYFNDTFYSHFPSNMVFFNKDIEYQLTIRDEMGAILNQQYPVTKEMRSYMNPFIEFASFSTNSGNLYYHVPKDNILYSLRKTKLVPDKEFDLGKYSFPDDFKWDYQNTQNAKTLNQALISKISVAGDIIFIKYSRKNNPGLIIHTDDITINAGDEENYGILDDIDGLGYIQEFYAQDSILVECLPAYELPEDPPTETPFSEKAKNLIKNTEFEDNFLIRIIELR